MIKNRYVKEKLRNTLHNFKNAFFTSPARPRGAGEATRETDLDIFDFESAPRGPRGARAGARIVTGGSTVDSPTYESSGAAKAVTKTARRSKKHD